MRFPGRVLSIGALAALLVALPGSSVASNSDLTKEGTTSSGAGPTITLPGGMDAVKPALSVVSGARIGTVGFADLTAWSGAAGGTIVVTPLSNGYLFYNSAGGMVLAALGLPAGATLWQIDVYGWVLPPGAAQTWVLYDQEADGGNLTAPRSLTIPSGSGIRTGTMSFPGGLTLATGHDWQIALNSMSSPTNGFGGAVFQYTLPTLSYVPITPVRLLDTRVGNGLAGKLLANTPATFQITGRGGIPALARAVTGNVTVVNETNSWAVYLGPNPIANPTTSTINFNVGDVRGNGLTVALSSTGSLSATYISTAGNTTDLVFDVTGYYL